MSYSSVAYSTIDCQLRRVAIFGSIAAAHVGLGLLFWQERSLTIQAVPAVSVSSASTLKPEPIRVLEKIALIPRPTFSQTMQPVFVLLPTQETEQSVTINKGAGTTAPRPLANDLSPTDFLPKVELEHGTRSTVVLRIEVRADGTPGHVKVEVSAGSAAVDRAAIAYVRALKWASGRINDKPETIWIRWGVTFNA